MTKIKKDYKIEDIITIVKAYNTENISLINTSYEYSSKLLDKDKLQDALNVSYLLTTVQADSETISANILSYLLTNNLVKRNDLEKEFEFNLVKLASNVNKLKNISLSTENDYLIEYYKKVIVGMTEDVRVIIVALADRVYLMHQLSKNDNNEENKRIAKETIEIFAPLAHHLGVYKLKSELEDLSLRYLKPDVYYDIVEKLNGTKTERDNTINEMMKEVSTLLSEHNIIHEIKGRSKSIYSIYNKLDKGRKFSDIYDLLAIRILVESESECYLVLGLIHSKFKPIAKRFKDFIAMPKSNGYQSLHTTVFGINNELFEIQIRTYEMNEIAENGVAAHWSYKENKSAFNLSRTDAKLEFFKAVIDMNQNDFGQDSIYNTIKEENSLDVIYVFTPKGDVIELPRGSTPVDFAYRVHTKIGDSMIGALVNNQIVPLNKELSDGDVVKINTSKSSPGPSEGWLTFVKLTQTKNKIKSFFAKTRRDELINFGKESLEKELRKRKISISDFTSSENIKKILKITKEKDLDTVYLEIGSNKYNPRYIINLIYEEKEEDNVSNSIITKNELDINVSGISDVKVNLASCCMPIPGDNIVGYITKNNGITIHRDNCSNLIHLEERIVDVRFNDVTKNKYLTCIMISLKNNQNRLGDILNKISGKNLIIDSVNTIYKDNILNYKINLYVNNLDALNKLINDLLKLRYVKNVERV